MNPIFFYIMWVVLGVCTLFSEEEKQATSCTMTESQAGGGRVMTWTGKP